MAVPAVAKRLTEAVWGGTDSPPRGVGGIQHPLQAQVWGRVSLSHHTDLIIQHGSCLHPQPLSTALWLRGGRAFVSRGGGPGGGGGGVDTAPLARPPFDCKKGSIDGPPPKFYRD